MATIGDIAVTLTANPKPFESGLAVAQQSVEKFSAATGKVSGVSRGASMGLLELSRGVEDATVGFQTNGLQGAVRGASNNLSQLGYLLAGPVGGAVAGFAAAGLSVMVSWLWKTRDAAKDAQDAIKGFADQIGRMQSEAKQVADTTQLASSLNTVEDIDREIKQRDALTRSIDAQNSVLQQQRQVETANRLRQGGPKTLLGLWTGQDIFGNDTSKVELSFKKDKEIHNEQMKLIEQRNRAEEEINKLMERRQDLQEAEGKQAQLDALGDAIGRRAEAQKKIDEKQRQVDIRGASAGIGIIQQQIAQLSPTLGKEFQQSLQLRQIDQMNLPSELKQRITDAMGDAFSLTNQSGDPTRLSEFTVAGSQKAAQAEFQAAQRQKSDELAKKAVDELRAVHKILDEVKKTLQDDAGTTINLDL